MMSRDDVLWEADEVEHGRLNLNNCDYPDEVEDELGAMNFDSRGNYRRSSPNWSQMNSNQNNNQKKDNGDKDFYMMCCGVLLILLIFSIIMAWF